MDGKQARRTKCASPLGQIFDHGMDTITFNLLIITGCRYYQSGDTPINFMGLCMGTTGYFVFNLKEYYIGEYFLQEINAIDEGSLVYFCFYMFAAFTGWESLTEPWFFGFRPYAILFYPTLVQ